MTSLAAARRPRATVLRLLLMAAFTVSACRGGCRPTEQIPTATPLAWAPRGTRVVASIDVTKIRQSRLWAALAESSQTEPADRNLLEALRSQTGFDPLQQIRRVLVLFPEDARARGEFAIFVECDRLDPDKLLAFTKERLARRGAKLETTTVRGRPIHRSAGEPQTGGFFVGRSVIVLAGGSWIEAVAALIDRQPTAESAERDLDLVRLLGRIDTTRPLWAAAVVPSEVRRALMADEKADAAASVMRIAASAGFAPGLDADLAAELSNAEDAQLLATRVSTTLRAAKANAQMLLLGLGPYIEAVNARADGPTLRIEIRLPEAQLGDLAARAAALARLGRERVTAPPPDGGTKGVQPAPAAK